MMMLKIIEKTRPMLFSILDSFLSSTFVSVSEVVIFETYIYNLGKYKKNKTLLIFFIILIILIIKKNKIKIIKYGNNK